MLFVELRFFAFFAIVLAVTWAIRTNTARKCWLLFASCLFYSAWDWRFLGLIAITVVVDYTVALLLERTDDARRRRRLILVSLISNLAILATFKYLNFFIDSAVALASRLGVPVSPVTLGIVLPLGISFYTFQTLSYTLDVYRRKLPAVRNMLDIALFVMFFPHSVAGPIVRARDFLPQFRTLPAWASVDVRRRLVQILVGFVKKACISDNIAPVVDHYFAAPSSFDAASSFLGVGSYAVQIYCDFSGYSDMALGLAGLLGYELCVNFRHPYIASSPSDFWRRWHVSLSSWLRDYLYIPLGGNRKGTARTYANLMITMLLGGLWHGAAWTFVIWGGLHGLGLVVQRLVAGGAEPAEGAPPPRRGPLRRAASVLATLYFTCLCWIFFRARDLPSALAVLSAYTGFGSPGDDHLPRLLAALLALLFAIHALASRELFSRWWRRIPSPLFALGWGALAALAIALSPVGYQPFIYFQF